MDQVISSLVSAFSASSNELIDAVVSILSVAVPVFGALCVVKLGIKAFKIFTYGNGADEPDHD